ncbi:MAG TPA: hypothetical protein VGV92_04100 [Gammaproteobacteria bacterium]|nr:hypothetical protein [Gammaproteobacteria bacterium]
MDENLEHNENKDTLEVTLAQAEKAVEKFNARFKRTLRTFIDELTEEENRDKKTMSDVVSDAQTTPAFHFVRSKK